MVRIAPRAGGTFEYLRAEIDYAGVVGRSTQLKPERGGAVLVGLCPLKEQQSGNPAFKVYPDGSCAVVATAEDYEAAHGIFKATSRRSVVNLSDTHRKIVQAVYALSLATRFPSDGFSLTKIADEAGVSKSTVWKNRAYLTMSAQLLYETEDKKLAISEDADPS